MPSDYHLALNRLREATRSGPDRSPFATLVRVVATNRAAARAVMRSPLRTRAQRRTAIVAAAQAMAAAKPADAE
jgi:hypothetical protein